MVSGRVCVDLKSNLVTSVGERSRLIDCKKADSGFYVFNFQFLIAANYVATLAIQKQLQGFIRMYMYVCTLTVCTEYRVQACAICNATF